MPHCLANRALVLDPALMLAVDVFPCEDGHAQEHSLLADVLLTVEEGDEWKRRSQLFYAKVSVWHRCSQG